MKQLFSILVAGLGVVPIFSHAQQTLNVTGHSAKIDSSTFDYSIGEMTLVSTERSPNLIITQTVRL